MNRFNIVAAAAVLAFASNAYAAPKECVNVQQLAEHVWEYSFEDECLVPNQAQNPRGFWDSVGEGIKGAAAEIWSRLPKGEGYGRERHPGQTGTRG